MVVWGGAGVGVVRYVRTSKPRGLLATAQRTDRSIIFFNNSNSVPEQRVLVGCHFVAIAAAIAGTSTG